MRAPSPGCSAPGANTASASAAAAPVAPSRASRALRRRRARSRAVAVGELVAEAGEVGWQRVVHSSDYGLERRVRVNGAAPRGQSDRSAERSASSRSGCAWR